MNISQLFETYEIWKEILNTIFMVVTPVCLAYLFGLPLGVLCVTSKPNGISPNKLLNKSLSVLINLGRSIPFIILLCLIVPFTRFIVGTSLGPIAAVVPLTVSCIPFVARMVEQSLLEIDSGVIDMAKCMGATNLQIVTKVYLPETVPSLLRGAAITAITLIGYTAMSGAVGAKGLGYLAIKQGYERNNLSLMYLCIVLVIIMVEITQFVLTFIAKRIDKK